MYRHGKKLGPNFMFFKNFNYQWPCDITFLTIHLKELSIITSTRFCFCATKDTEMSHVNNLNFPEYMFAI